MDAPRADEIQALVARITSSEFFAESARLRRFLRYTVECKLAGREEQVKEYVIGREVFDRGNDFDPRIDPIVRVEARRLRSRLAEYFAGPGRDEPLRIEYPKGGYLPVVRPVDAVRQAGTRTPRSRWIVSATALALIAAMVAFVVGRPPKSPVVAPIPTTWIQPNDGTLEPTDVALAEDVDADLANQPGTRVVAWPEIVREKSLRFLALRDFASELGANRLLLILVRDVGSNKLVRVFAIDEPSGRKRLALTYAQPKIATFAEQDALAARIALDLRKPSGS
jgi:hypothetical protein